MDAIYHQLRQIRFLFSLVITAIPKNRFRDGYLLLSFGCIVFWNLILIQRSADLKRGLGILAIVFIGILLG